MRIAGVPDQASQRECLWTLGRGPWGVVIPNVPMQRSEQVQLACKLYEELFMPHIDADTTSIPSELKVPGRTIDIT
jgi:hypothetical protein